MSRSQKPPQPPEPEEAGLPRAIDAERSVLGYLLVGGAWREDVTAHDFAGERHQTIWHAMAAIHNAGDDVDRQRVIVELGEKKLKHVGVGYLSELAEGCFPEMKIEAYVRALHDAAGRRDVLHHAHILLTHIHSGDRNADQLIEMGSAAFAGLRNGKTESGEFLIENLPPVWRYEVSVKWIWDGIIPEGSITLLTGEAGGGKSTFALKLAAQIATGHAFLGRAVSQQPVLYIDGENPLFVVKDRLLRLGITEHPNLKIWGTWNEPPAEGPGSAKILRFAEKYQPLIIFDSKKQFDGGDEQDATETRRHMNLYRRFSIVGASVLLLHNSGKSDGSHDYRGSSDIKAAVDSAFLLERTDGLDCGAPLGSLRLKPFKTRVMAGTEIRFQYTEAEGFTTSETSQRSPIEKLEDLIRANPLRTQRQLIELAKNIGISKNSIGALLLEGHQRGKFTFQTGRSGAQRWQLCEPDLT